MKTVKIFQYLFLIFLVVFVVSALRKDQWPGRAEILEPLYQDPVQESTPTEPFAIKKNGATYTITPLYDYTLYGMVVSYHHSSSFGDYYHKEWGDFINTKDICVIWGENIKTEIYKKIEFSSGSWTCYAYFPPSLHSEDMQQFKHACLSNNHLLTIDRQIARSIMSMERGDQVYLKGYLVNYGKDDIKNFRATSTTRQDHGCEVIYVTEARILKKANILWRSLFFLSKFVMLISGILFVIAFVKNYPKNNLENQEV